jgi:type VI protein secretion system component VasK
LLRLPAVGDNAAMEAEPPVAAEPKRKRRWFQFSLRTLMIAVTLLAVACWVVADRARLIRERDEALLQAAQERHKAERIDADFQELADQFVSLRRQLEARPEAKPFNRFGDSLRRKFTTSLIRH